MMSGDVIWCSVCGCYADLKVGGLTEACTGRHTGPWKGGGKRGQLNSLRKNRHPRTRILLPLPIAESTMTLDEAAGASHAQLAEAAVRMTRYSARDKAAASANAHKPSAALTDEKRQWIHNKRSEAIQRAARKRAQHEIPVPVSSWAQRIRESYCGKRPRFIDSQSSCEPDAGPHLPAANATPMTAATPVGSAARIRESYLGKKGAACQHAVGRRHGCHASRARGAVARLPRV